MADTSVRGKFVWHDLMTTDTDGAIKFYSQVTGWGTQPWEGPMPYTMWTRGGVPIGGLMVLPPGAGSPPHWLAYVGTADVDATAAQAVTLGGKVMVPPTDIPTVGRFAVLADPQGAVFAAFKPLPEQPSNDGPPVVGDFSWHELATTDPVAAWSFYQALFGWDKTTAFDMGPMGEYQMYGRNGLELGGIMKKPAEMPGPPSWLHYIMVDDVARVAGVATASGGQILNGPMEVPGGDLVATGMDPQGGIFAVHSKAK